RHVRGFQGLRRTLNQACTKGRVIAGHSALKTRFCPRMTDRWWSVLEQRRQLRLELGLDRLRGPQDRARLQEVERAEGADPRPHDEVGRAVLDFLRGAWPSPPPRG